MAKSLNALILSVAVAATTLIPLTEAQADQRWRHRQRHHEVRHHDNSGLIVAGIVGLAVGAIIAGSAASRRAAPAPIPVGPAPDSGYFPPAPIAAGDQPRVIYTDDPDTYAPSEPWTREWYRYCASRFRSFDPDSGTYLGYDGRRHFCVAR